MYREIEDKKEDCGGISISYEFQIIVHKAKDREYIDDLKEAIRFV